MQGTGILLHLTSLPGAYGIGALDPEARRFLDFLADSGQTVWQILPVGMTSYGDSPYQSPSAFAGNPYLIDFEELRQLSRAPSGLFPLSRRPRVRALCTAKPLLAGGILSVYGAEGSVSAQRMDQMAGLGQTSGEAEAGSLRCTAFPRAGFLEVYTVLFL